MASAMCSQMIFHAVEFIGSFIDGQKGIVQVTGRQIAIVSQLKVQQYSGLHRNGESVAPSSRLFQCRHILKFN
jgi:hypothetical protein